MNTQNIEENFKAVASFTFVNNRFLSQWEPLEAVSEGTECLQITANYDRNLKDLSGQEDA